jgi:hypothetical protein
MSASEAKAAIFGYRFHVAEGPILLQKFQNAERQISRQNTERAVIAGRYALKRVTEVICEFSSQ